MTRLLMTLSMVFACLSLGSCSGCHRGQAPEGPAPASSQTVNEDNGEAPPNLEEGAEAGPTDEIETPADQLAPTLEPGSNE